MGKTALVWAKAQEINRHTHTWLRMKGAKGVIEQATFFTSSFCLKTIKTIFFFCAKHIFTINLLLQLSALRSRFSHESLE